jgi:hypothetical protein
MQAFRQRWPAGHVVELVQTGPTGAFSAQKQSPSTVTEHRQASAAQSAPPPQSLDGGATPQNGGPHE